MALITSFTTEDFALLQADFSGTDATRRTTAVPRLVAFLQEAPEAIRQYMAPTPPHTALVQAHHYESTPLPAGLQGEAKGHQWLPILRQLYLYHGLYAWDIGKCFHLRWAQEGPSRPLLFELIECFSFFPVTRLLFAQDFATSATPTITILWELLPLLPDNRVESAIALFGACGATGQRHLPALFNTLDAAQPTRTKHTANALSALLKEWQDLLDPDELFAGLRTLLALDLTTTRSALLIALISAWGQHNDTSMAMDYVQHHLHPTQYEHLAKALDKSSEQSSP